MALRELEGMLYDLERVMHCLSLGFVYFLVFIVPAFCQGWLGFGKRPTF